MLAPGQGCLFGTDGVRGTVGTPPMVPDRLVRLGYALGTVLGGPGREVVVGKDTRLSGYMVESAIESGLAGAGLDVALTGPLPSAAIAMLASQENAAAGVVISASHNPHHDNGIKVFNSGGCKLSDAAEREIERLAAEDGPAPDWTARPGKARRIDDAAERYVNFCLNSAPGLSLAGRKIVVDAANGAAYYCAPEVFRRLGAQVVELGCAPDGLNINVGCGALEPELAKGVMLECGAECAVVLDGDADRLLLIDCTGRVLNGDACLYILARHAVAAGGGMPGMAGTLMSNCALEAAVRAMGVEFARAPVGDRNVAALLNERGWLIGGEPSGHLLLLDRHSTGDGVLAALAVLDAALRMSGGLAEAGEGFVPLPAVHLSLNVRNGAQDAAQLAAVASREQSAAGVERVVVRLSGTEPVVRILVEAQSGEAARASAERIASELDGQALSA